MAESKRPRAPVGSHYPLVFSCVHLVRGEDFLARVAMNSRIFEVIETDGIWMYGVNPGAIAGGGSDGTDAFRDFKKHLRAATQEMADDSGSFSTFKTKIEEFFNATAKPTEVEWNDAVQGVREGRITLPGAKVIPNAKWWIKVSALPISEPKPEIRAVEKPGSINLAGANTSDFSKVA